MSSYNYKLGTFTYNGKEAAEELGLPYGRNILYRKLIEKGLLDETHMPTDEMIQRKFMTYVLKKVNKGGMRVHYHPVPIFTESGLRFLKQIFKTDKTNEA